MSETPNPGMVHRPEGYDPAAPIPAYPQHPADMEYAHLDRAAVVVIFPDDGQPARCWTANGTDREIVATVLRELADVIVAPPAVVEVPRA